MYLLESFISSNFLFIHDKTLFCKMVFIVIINRYNDTFKVSLDVVKIKQLKSINTTKGKLQTPFCIRSFSAFFAQSQ